MKKRAAKTAKSARLDRLRDEVLAYALSLPGAFEDHPWGETVAKVGKKVFVFFGSEASPTWPSMTVKLVESHDQAMAIPGTEPTGYGLGKSGWVTFEPAPEEMPSLETLKSWIDESYCAQAPKKLAAQIPFDAAPKTRSTGRARAMPRARKRRA